MSYPYLNEFQIDARKRTPLYLQISQGLAGLIKQGILRPGQKLPGSRILASQLGVNRNTITLAVDELLSEGWLEAKPRSGLYVNQRLPLVRMEKEDLQEQRAEVAGFEVYPDPLLEVPEVANGALQFNDGIPDPRLSPLNELGREYNRLLKKGKPFQLFSYGNAQGDPELRKALSQDLGENRGLQICPEQLLISRGSIMALYLIARVVLKQGDGVVVGELNYRTANLCFEQAGARLFRIPVDEKGLDTAALESLLEREKVRMLYVTSHHHHPTTVTLAAERRIHLYELAKKWRFIILEDDYDFDYHYENKPTLPLASMDRYGLVVYIGSYSKIIYPGIRIGFIAAPRNVVEEMVKYRRILDRQGDHVLERAIANLMKEGLMQRYLRKSKKEYKRRKEFFCLQLRTRFISYLTFTEPEGGMAVWVQFKEAYPLPDVSKKCIGKGLYLSSGTSYNPPGTNLNACRMGFASMNLDEIEEACTILEEVLKKMEQEKRQDSYLNG